MVILGQYYLQIPHCKGNRVKFGPILGQKMGKSGSFWDFHLNSLVWMSQNCRFYHWNEMWIKICLKNSVLGDFEPKFRPNLGQKWYKVFIFKVFTSVLQFYRHIIEINMVFLFLVNWKNIFICKTWYMGILGQSLGPICAKKWEK